MKQTIRLLCLSAAILAFFHLRGANVASKFVYVANTSSHEISAYAVDSATGALTTVPGSPFAAANVPW